MKDAWEDGIPLTSGRSGLASAVIYQPSCHHSYTQDSIGNMTSNREYDDEKRPDNQDDDSDLSSRGASSSYHFDCPPNFFSNRSEGAREEIEMPDCDKLSEGFYDLLKEMNVRFRQHVTNAPTSEMRADLQKELNDSTLLKLTRFHTRCKKHSACPLRTLKRRFRHFIFSSKALKPKDELEKQNGVR